MLLWAVELRVVTSNVEFTANWRLKNCQSHTRWAAQNIFIIMHAPEVSSKDSSPPLMGGATNTFDLKLFQSESTLNAFTMPKKVIQIGLREAELK